MIRILFFAFCLHCALFGAEVLNFEHLSKTKGVVFCLTSPRSGSNVISASLGVITRRPIWWTEWKDDVLDPSSSYRKYPAYNRVDVPLVSRIPLLYRTHDDFDLLRQVPSEKNKLIFVTRNPKELIYREYLREPDHGDNPSYQYIESFLDAYLKRFHLFESWSENNRMLVYYEDFIAQGDGMLLQLLRFMGRKPKFLDDYLRNKEKYVATMLKTYTKQHKGAGGGASARGGPKPIYYTRNASPVMLAYIDEYLQRVAPSIWEKYLKRFETESDTVPVDI